MKLFISFFMMMISISSFAHKIVIYNTLENEKWALQVKNEFLKKYKIPFSLMEIHKTKECDSLNTKKKYLIVCLDKKKELVVINSSSQIIKTLSVFKRL